MGASRCAFVAEPAPKKKAKAKKAAPPKPKPTKNELSVIRKAAGTKNIKDFDGLIARFTQPMNKKEIQALAEEHGHGSAYLVKKHWSEIESRLDKINERQFEKTNK